MPERFSHSFFGVSQVPDAFKNQLRGMSEASGPYACPCVTRNVSIFTSVQFLSTVLSPGTSMCYIVHTPPTILAKAPLKHIRGWCAVFAHFCQFLVSDKL